MAWPLGVPLGGVHPQDYLRLLLRLLPDGYSQDPDGPRVTELEAYAEALWVGRVAIDRAIANAFQDRAVELLEEWELAYRLPNDAARTVEQRQDRLVAAERSLAGASAERMAAALTKVAPLALAQVNRAADIAHAAAAAFMVWQFGVQLDESEFANPAIRRAVSRVLQRLVPARLRPVPGWRRAGDFSGPLDDSERLFVTEGATWGGTERLGTTVLGRQDAVQRSVRPPACRTQEYAGLSRLEAEDLNALQDLTVMQRCNGAASINYASAGDDSVPPVHFAVLVPPSTTVQIDDSIDWRDRYILSVLRFHSSVDIRPGVGGGDPAPDETPAQFAIEELWSSGAGDDGSGTGIQINFGGLGVFLYADDTDGSLYARHSSPGDTYAFVGFCLASPALGVA